MSRGPGILRRLTLGEYQASLTALFGEDVPEGEPLAGNIEEDVYSTRASGLRVRDLAGQRIALHAEAVAQWAAAESPELVISCTELSAECVEQTVGSFGRKAFRMPLSDEQVARYVALFLQGERFEQGLEMFVATVLQSPYFLYRRELGVEGGDAAPLSDHELGSSLAYMLTGSPPDDELSLVVDSGSLREEAVWEGQVARLLDSTLAEERLTEFLVEWLELDRVLSKTKTEDGVELIPSLREAMLLEAKENILAVYRAGGSFRDLISHPQVYLNEELAEHYGTDGPASDVLTPMPLGDRTGGLLGTGAFLLGHSTVDTSSPTARGIFIRQSLLCLEVPPPPPALDTDLPAATGAMTTRQRFSSHLSSPVCASCHEGIDNYGFAFEAYDGLGRYRTEEEGILVDSTGVTVGLDSGEVAFSNAEELTAILSQDAQVERCFHQHLLEFTLGQENWDNQCSVNQVATSSQNASGSLKDALRSTLALPHFEARLAQGAL